LKEKYKTQFPDSVDTSQTQTTTILEMPKDEGEVKRDKFGRKIIREQTKSVQIIEPEPPRKTQTPEDAQSSTLYTFSIKSNPSAQGPQKSKKEKRKVKTYHPTNPCQKLLSAIAFSFDSTAIHEDQP
jgi:hypothetical protein